MNRFFTVLCIALAMTSCDYNRYSPWGNWGNNGGSGSQSDAIAEDDISIPSVSVESDDINTDDNIANTTFNREVIINFNENGDASVTGTNKDISVVIAGNDVSVTNNGSETVKYILKGTTSDGFFKLYSSKKQAIVLSNVSITNPGGAAINVQSKKRTFVVLDGSSYLKDGEVDTNGDYIDQKSSSEEDMKAAFFSEAQLIFSGEGSLEVNAIGKSGITSDDYIRIMNNASLSITSALGHGIRGKDAIIISGGKYNISVSGVGKKGLTTDSLMYIGGGEGVIDVKGAAGDVDGELTGAAGIKADCLFVIDDGNLSITASGKGAKGISCDGIGHFKGGTVNVKVTGSNYGSSSSGGFPGWGGGQSSSNSNSSSAKGIKFDGDLYFYGSDVTSVASSHEAIESKGVIYIHAGSVYAYSSDDAINSDNSMKIDGGYVYAQATNNDGLDANGNMYISGGYVYAVGTELGLDANTEGGSKLYLSDGIVIAIGGIESNSSITPAMVSVSCAKNTNYALFDGNDLKMAFKTPSTGGNGIYFTCKGMEKGDTYTLKTGADFSGGTNYFDLIFINPTVSGGTSATLTAANTSGTGMGGGGGFGPGGRF